MYKLFIHEDAQGDLDQLWNDEPQAAARIAVVLQEIQEDQNLLDRLTQHDFGLLQSAKFHVSKWVEHWRKGRDLWRLKVWDLENKGLRYRIVYAFVPGKKQYHVLAIAPRDFDYKADHELTKRILRAHEAL